VLKYRIHENSVSEQQQELQLQRVQAIVNDACSRRGLPPRTVSCPPWRPVGRRSRADRCIHYGWIGFLRGDWKMALEYSLQAVRLMPWRREGWKLVAYSLLKSPPNPAVVSSGES
jgi:hypothetical protein